MNEMSGKKMKSVPDSCRRRVPMVLAVCLLVLSVVGGPLMAQAPIVDIDRSDEYSFYIKFHGLLEIPATIRPPQFDTHQFYDGDVVFEQEHEIELATEWGGG